MKELNTWKEVVEAIIAGEKLEYYLEASKVWVNCQYLPNISINELSSQPPNRYRAKPRTILIGDMEVPEPVRDVSELEMREGYYLPDLHRARLYDVSSWDGDDLDLQLLKHGLVHKTKEAALLHAKALIKISGGSYE